ncbi:MAG TPA: DNA polymerase III subunit alpha [Deltaproteobacteria bacterium]|nr:DNA polymerase III subunit alpha [Deltaproteobacteria bacterium]
MQHADFVHLHLHTHYSLLDGAIRPERLFELAREFKMPAVAVTDHGNMFGAVDFYRQALEAGVKPIIGCEVYVAPGSRRDRSPSAGRGEGTYHLVLLVKDLTGYRNLCKLVSRAYLEGFYYKPRIDKELLREYSEGLIALSACLHGEVAHWAAMGDRGRAKAAARSYMEIFPDRRFFLELQDNGIEEQKKVNRLLVELAGELGLPLVATNDCHYLRREESRFHDILLCVQTGKTVNSPDRMRFSTDQFYFKSPEEMRRLFADVPEALANTVEIAERCSLELELGTYHLPDFAVPEGETLDSLLEKKAREGLEARFAAMAAKGADVEGVRWSYLERLEKELKVIKGMGFPGYFLIVWDFIEYARSRDIPVGPGRGSAAGSLVAWALGITSLDPIKNNLLFERFLNPDRISMPDIDVDFCYERRDEVIRYVTEKYGSENVTQIITFGQMKARAVIRDVGRALDMSYGEVDRIAKLVPDRLDITIDKAVDEEPRLKELIDSDARVAELIEAARALEGLPRHASTHAAGVVISNRPLVEYLPLYKGQKDDVVTTQYAMKDVEAIGLVKFDFLGLKTLTVMDRAVKEIRRSRGVDLSLEDLPLDDARTYALVASGNTNGVFQFESSGMKELLRKMRPGSFEDLTAAVALYRPGPLQSGMVDDFIMRKHGRTPIVYELDELEPILESTYGVMVYQEQVMEIAKTLAGYTPGDADKLRKAMGKKLDHVMIAERERFLKGAEKNGIDPRTAEKIFDLMAHFAGYGFNKSHSAAYALISYQTAWLKAHYPVEFMAALLSSERDRTDKVVLYTGECRESGIEVLAPDINRSMLDFTVEDGKIRFGLGAVKNVGRGAIEEIVRARSEGPFTSLVDFLSRVDTRKVNKKVVESLVKCGAMDGLGANRASLAASLDAAMEVAQGVQRDRAAGQGSIFDMLGGAAATAERSFRAVEVDEWPLEELLANEKESLGFYFSSHPLESRTEELKRATTDTTRSIKERGGAAATIGGVVTAVRETTTKKGDRMAFVTIDDMAGSCEVVVFSDVYARAREVLEGGEPVVVTGKVEVAEGTDGKEPSVKMIAAEITPLDRAADIEVKKTHIVLPTEGLDRAKLVKLRELIEANPGRSPVFLHLVGPGRREQVLRLPMDLAISPVEKTFAKIRKLVGASEVKLA